MIEANIGVECTIQKILVDNSNAVDVLFLQCFERMGLRKDQLQMARALIYDFTNITVFVVVTINFQLSLKERKGRVSRAMELVRGGRHSSHY